MLKILITEGLDKRRGCQIKLKPLIGGRGEGGEVAIV